MHGAEVAYGDQMSCFFFFFVNAGGSSRRLRNVANWRRKAQKGERKIGDR